MPSLQVFLSKDDWSEIFSLTKRKYIFFKIGHYNIKNIQPLFFEKINKGLSIYGKSTLDEKFLCVNEGYRISYRKISSEKFAIDQKENPGSICISLGGKYENCFISGSIGTILKDETSRIIYDDWSKAVKTSTKKLKSFYIGKHSLPLLGNGENRFTTDISTTINYDLTI